MAHYCQTRLRRAFTSPISTFLPSTLRKGPSQRAQDTVGPWEPHEIFGQQDRLTVGTWIQLGAGTQYCLFVDQHTLLWQPWEKAHTLYSGWAHFRHTSKLQEQADFGGERTTPQLFSGQTTSHKSDDFKTRVHLNRPFDNRHHSFVQWDET